ncbi:MAG: serine hydrolase, partial [Cyclobacteriaceae bacterium]|nr:serine hydrolase [Cyclobacteriaceae bacterium]
MMRILFILLFAMATVGAHAQTIKNLATAKPEEAGFSTDRLARIDLLINEYTSKKWIPGAVVLIARNGKIIQYKAYGYSDFEKQTPLKKDDIFRMASQTKAITSLAVMMLFE